LIAVPSVLVDGGVKGVTTLLKLFFELRQMIELLLLLGSDLVVGLRVGCRALRPHARRTCKEECNS